MNKCCFIGRAKAYITDPRDNLSWGYNYGYSWGTAAGSALSGQFIGNVSSLILEPQHSFRETIDFKSELTGQDCAVSVFEGARLSMNLTCHSAENLATALYGYFERQTTPPSPVVDKAVTPPSGGFRSNDFISFNNLGVDITSVVVEDFLTSTALDVDQDYSIDKFGITFLVPYAGSVKLSYTYDAGHENIQAFSQPSKAVSLLINGINLADTKELFKIKIYKVRLSTASNYEIIGDNISEFLLTGIIEPNNKITTPNKSKYLNIQKLI